jgi:uncharacterized protein
METSFERLPDGLDDVAFLYGPIVLAAETGTNDMTGLQAGDGRWDHIAKGPIVPLDEAPTLVCKPDDIAGAIQPVPNKSLTFTLGSAVQPAKDQALELVPFYRLADTRYVIYWQHFSPQEYQPKMEQIHAEEAATVALDQDTIDLVTPGEQQPEVDHHFQGADSSTGYFQNRHWRDGKGWFSYDLKTVPGQPLSLAVTYWGGDKGRNFTILANDTQIADVSLKGEKPESFETINYPIPASLVGHAPNGMLTIKFVAQLHSVAGGVFDVRLVKAPKAFSP